MHDLQCRMSRYYVVGHDDLRCRHCDTVGAQYHDRHGIRLGYSMSYRYNAMISDTSTVGLTYDIVLVGLQESRRRTSLRLHWQ